MKIKFLDNIIGALKILKDGRLKEAVKNAFLLIGKIRNVASFLRTEGAGIEKIEKVTGGIGKGLDNVEGVLAKILAFFKIAIPLSQKSAPEDLDEALDELAVACGAASASAADLPEGAVDLDEDDD